MTCIQNLQSWGRVIYLRTRNLETIPNLTLPSAGDERLSCKRLFARNGYVPLCAASRRVGVEIFVSGRVIQPYMRPPIFPESISRLVVLNRPWSHRSQAGHRHILISFRYLRARNFEANLMGPLSYGYDHPPSSS